MRLLTVKRICLTFFLLAWFGPGRGSHAEEGPDRPNFLFIMPDQMRGMAMGCTGNPDVISPNLDRLASQGILFPNTFANTPVCCPARANILTGQYAHTNGMICNDLRLRESRTSVAEVFAEAGYRTGFIGKWHLDGGKRLPGFVPPGPRRQGFQFWAACQCSHQHFSQTYFRDTDQPIKSKKFETEEWTDLAVEFLLQESAQPFFLMIQMGPPHNPYRAPEKYTRMYDPDKLTLRPNYREIPSVGRKEIASYYAMITAVDDQVGRLMKTLETIGEDKNTVVFFTSDHGDMLGSHGQRLKRKPWEESIRVPGILRYPDGVKAGQVVETLLTHVDLAPTFLGLANLKVPEAMQGANLADLVLGKTRDGPDSAFFQIFVPFSGGDVHNPWRGVRTERYMYARTEDGPWVLHDLEKDPHELNNLASDPAYRLVREKLEREITGWMDRIGDSWNINSMEYVEDRGRLYRHETFYTLEEYFEWAKKNPDKVK